jgi:hypothetical protein
MGYVMHAKVQHDYVWVRKGSLPYKQLNQAATKWPSAGSQLLSPDNSSAAACLPFHIGTAGLPREESSHMSRISAGAAGSSAGSMAGAVAGAMAGAAAGVIASALMYVVLGWSARKQHRPSHAKVLSGL